MAKLVLFDVDDTLLKPVGSYRHELWDEMFQEVFGIKEKTNVGRRSGMTEKEIIIDVCLEGGIDKETAIKKLHQAYRVVREKTSTMEMKALPGARELLEVLKEADEIKVGLLTGNSEDRAWMKLEKAGMRGFFRFGVFSEDAETREDLFQVALEKAEMAFGMRFDPKDVWIIGDTPKDVRTAVRNGARCMAVLTGPFKERDLLEEGADFVLKGLADYKRIINIILGKEE